MRKNEKNLTFWIKFTPDLYLNVRSVTFGTEFQKNQVQKAICQKDKSEFCFSRRENAPYVGRDRFDGEQGVLELLEIVRSGSGSSKCRELRLQ
jgi:hypothetical protein